MFGVLPGFTVQLYERIEGPAVYSLCSQYQNMVVFYRMTMYLYCDELCMHLCNESLTACQPESFSLSPQLLAAGAPAIHHGNPLTDRKSTFQAHVAQVHSKEEVSWSCAVLYCDKTSLYTVQCCIVIIHLYIR